MANTKQSTKRARQAKKREAKNAPERTGVRSSIKKALKVIAAKDKQAAEVVLQKTASILDKAAKHHILHRNKAARLKSRLQKKLKTLLN